MATTLQDLRKEAGYKTAKEFALSVGIPVPTYTRYEQEPAKIPVDRAWKIADALGCSIDAVVGREHVDVADMRGDFQKLVDALSSDDQRLVWSIVEVVKERADDRERRRKREENHKYDRYASYYEKLFMQEADGDPDLGDTVVFGTPVERRNAFEHFLNSRAAKKRADKVDAERAGEEDRIRGDAGVILTEDGPVYCDDEPRFSEMLDQMLGGVREELDEKYKQEDEAEIQKIMAAYDRLHDTQDQLAKAFQLHRLALDNVLHDMDWQKLSEIDLSALDSTAVERGMKSVQAILSSGIASATQSVREAKGAGCGAGSHSRADSRKGQGA